MKGVLLTVSLLSCLLAPTYSSLQVERFIREQLPNASNSSYHSATHSGHGPPWETCDYEADHFPHIWLVLYLNLILFLFLGLAIICDDFFVPSLEAISDKLDLSEDVAGATFMAAGSSAPELFTSVAGVGVNSDVGVGTIVGSAMFNILIIVAMSAVLAGKTLYLDWKPLCRDAFVYSISIVLLVGFSWDGRLEWYEVTILLLFYIAYILLMKVNSFIMTLLDQLTCGCCQHKTIVAPEDEGSGKDNAHERNDLEEGQTGMVKESESGGSKHKFAHSHKGELAGIAVSHRRRSTVEHISVLTQIMDIHRRESHAHGHTHPHPHPIEEESSVTPTPSSSSSYEEDEPKIKLLPFLPPIIAAPPNPDMIKLNFGILRFIIKWHLFVLSFPYVVLFTWTIPNCSRSRKWYRVAGSFCSSVLWIAALSFALVTLVAKTGCILDVDSFVMGLVVIAVGTSIPDAMSSILVARDGFGDMAVSNAIGSNVFDINLGLGLPFLIRILIDKGKAFSLLSSTQQEMYQAGLYTILPHPKFGLLLLVVVLTILVMLSIIRCRLNKITGLFLVFIYALFLGYAFTQELVCLQGVYC